MASVYPTSVMANWSTRNSIKHSDEAMNSVGGSQGYDDPLSAEDELDDQHELMNNNGQVRAELRDRINKKRKQAGLDYIVIEPKLQMREHLSAADVEKRERRKASNRNAARRCREKKVQAHQKLVKAKQEADSHIKDLADANTKLSIENQQLAQQNKQLFAFLSKCTCQEIPHSILNMHKISTSPKPIRHRHESPLASPERRVEADSGIAVTNQATAKQGASSSDNPVRKDVKIELTVAEFNNSNALVDEYMATPDSSQSDRSSSPLDLSQNSRPGFDFSQESNDEVLDLRKQ